MDEQQLSALRVKAEKILERKLKDIAEIYKNYDLEALFEEIAVYHTELEAQNEELWEKQLELERSQQEHKLLYDHAPIGYVVLDGHFNIIRANIKATRDLHLSVRFSEVKKAFISYLGKGHLEMLLNWLKDEAHLHEPLEVELLRGEEKRWYRLFRNHTPEDENYVMLSMVDIHEEKILKNHLEEKVEEGIAKLREQQALMIQQSKMAEAGNMLEAIIHQWKQPLNVIVMAAGAVNSAVCDPGNKEEAESMEQTLLKQAHFMSETINDFRDFFQPKKMEVKVVPCQLFDKIKKMFKGLFEKHGVEIVIESHEHFQVMGRSSEFMQVLLNVFNNARDAILEKHGQKGGFIICHFEQRGAMGLIRIRDNGGGIPEELLPEKLFQSHVTTKGKDGTGIGLQISRWIIENHMKGKIWAHNVEEGAEFVIELPLADGGDAFSNSALI